MRERGVEHDDRVRLLDRVAAADRSVVVARVRAHRRAAPLGPVLGERLHALALAQEGDGEQLGGGLRALAGPRVPADLLHAAVPRSAIDRARGELALAHGLDDRGAAVGGVARGVEPRSRSSGPGSTDGAAARAERSSANSGRGCWPIAMIAVSAGNDVLAARDRLGPRPAARVRLAELHADALDAFEPVRPRKRVGAVSQRSSTPSSRASAPRAGRRASPPRCAGRASVTSLGAEADGLARDVDRRVAAADDGDVAADLRRRAGLQRLDERQRAPDAVEVVARQERRRVGAHADREHDRVVHAGDREQLRAVDPAAEDELGAQSRDRPASSGSGWFCWRYGAIA